MNLIYIQNIKHLKHFLSNNAYPDNNNLIISHDMAVCYELENSNLDYIDEWDYISKQEVYSNWNMAHSLSNEWDPYDLIKTIIDNSISSSAVKEELVYPFWAALNAVTIYKEIFNKYNVVSVKGYFSEEKIAVIRNGPSPTSTAIKCVTEAILIYLCELKNISIESIIYKNDVKKGRPQTFKNFVKLINNSVEIKKLNKGKKIVIYEPGMRSSDLKVIISVLNKRFNDYINLIIFTENDFANINLDKNLEIDCQINEYLIKRSNNYKGIYPEIFSNHHLHFQFFATIKEILRSEVIAYNFKSTIEVLDPLMVFFGHDAFITERLMVRSSKSMGICTASVMHSGLGFDFGNRGITGESDKIIVWNDDERNTLVSDGVLPNKISAFGAIRYFEELKATSAYKIKNKKNIHNNNNNNNKFTVLILTAEINTGHAAPIACPYRHRLALRYIIRLVEIYPEIEFVIKPHPSYDYFDLYEGFNSYKFKNLKVALKNSNLSDQIANASMILMVNYYTTAALDAFKNRVPVVLLENAVYDLPRWKNDKRKDFLLSLSSIDDLEHCINLLRNDKLIRSIVAARGLEEFNKIVNVHTLKRLELNIENLVQEEIIKKADINENKKNLITTNDAHMFYYAAYEYAYSHTSLKLNKLFNHIKRNDGSEYISNKNKEILIAGYSIGLLFAKDIYAVLFSLYYFLYLLILTRKKSPLNRIFYKNYLKTFCRRILS